MSSELYEPLIERDLDGFREAARALPSDDLWIAVARFAVLAYAPSQHSKRAVMAVRAAYDVRGEAWRDLIFECARYAAESRQPWSEPPILEDLDVPSEEELRSRATGDALLMLDTAVALIPLLGEKGRAALLRMPMMELEAHEPQIHESLDALIERAIAERGSIESVRDVFVALVAREWSAGVPPADAKASRAFARAAARDAAASAAETAALPYRLARDYAQTLIAHSFVARFPPGANAQGFLAAVHENLEHGESYADFSFA